mgnify:FL=1
MRMRRLVLLLLLLAQWGAARAGHVVTDSVRSKVLGTWVKCNVYLPDGFGKEERMYPVVYLLHGLSDDYTAWLDKGGMNLVADELVASGEADGMVIVMPNAGGPDVRNTQCGYFNMQGWNYEDFFFQELMPQMEEKYRVVADKGHRAVMGLSMGGGGSVSYCQRHPELFCACFAMSAWLACDDFKEEPQDRQDCLYRTREAVNRLSTIRFMREADEATLGKLRTVGWFLDCGDDDFLFDVNAAMHQLMRDKGVRHEFRVRNGVHNWEYWHYSLRLALPFVSRCFAPMPPVR